jgi:thymidylate synthase
MTTSVLVANNVNDAFEQFKVLARDQCLWRKIAPRGLSTLEWQGPFITEYLRPNERVLFDPNRDANPFFHFFESLWILDGRHDVAYLSQFNSNISSFSDDGISFHAPYGHRLRRTPRQAPGYGRWIEPLDQIGEAIRLLRADHDTRQVVLSIWDPGRDLGAKTKDVPCNDLIMLKVRDGKLDMTVACRSNDAIWGCYGANAVQFSVIQEFIALAVGVNIGCYRQVSDSFHIYHEREDWKRCSAVNRNFKDPYENVTHYPLMSSETNYIDWLFQLNLFTNERLSEYRGDIDQFFTMVASPLLYAWRAYKADATVPTKNTRIDLAKDWLSTCWASDWRTACYEWLDRRREH